MMVVFLGLEQVMAVALEQALEQERGLVMVVVLERW